MKQRIIAVLLPALFQSSKPKPFAFGTDGGIPQSQGKIDFSGLQLERGYPAVCLFPASKRKGESYDTPSVPLRYARVSASVLPPMILRYRSSAP